MVSQREFRCAEPGCNGLRLTSAGGRRYLYCETHQREHWRKEKADRDARKAGKKAATAKPKAAAPARMMPLVVLDYNRQTMVRCAGVIQEEKAFPDLRRGAPQPHVIGLLRRAGYSIATIGNDQIAELTRLACTVERLERFLKGKQTVDVADVLMLIAGVEPLKTAEFA